MNCAILDRQSGKKSVAIDLVNMVCDHSRDCRRRGVCARSSGIGWGFRTVLAVWGMGCPRCAMRVHNGLLGVDGILLVEVILERGMAGVAYDPAQVDPSGRDSTKG